MVREVATIFRQQNILCVPLLVSAHSSVSRLHVALFNACWVGTLEKRYYISSHINDSAIDFMFFTETWLRFHRDEARITDLAARGYTVKSFPCLSSGGGITVIFKNSLSSHPTVKAFFSPHCQGFSPYCQSFLLTPLSRLILASLITP